MQRMYAMNPVTIGLHNNTLYEPQRNNNFEVYIYLPAILAGGDAGRTEEFRKYITLSTQSFALPEYDVQAASYSHNNVNVKMAGAVNVTGEGTLDCIDYIGADVEGILYAWQNLVYSPETGQIGWAYNYKTDAKVLEYSADGACLASWILRGVWPSRVQPGSGLNKDGGAGSIKHVQVTLQYDLGYRKFGESTRNQHQAAAAQAMNDMNWKPQGSYSDSNMGGSIEAVKDSFN